MIKKLLLLFLSCYSLQAMENNAEWTIKYNNTKIHLTTQSLYDVCENVNIAIVGHYEQDLLFQCHPDFIHTLAARHYSRVHIYKTKDIYKKKQPGICMTFIEPYLKKSSYLSKHDQLAKRWEYSLRNKNQDIYGDAAFKQASKDLALCYHNALSFIHSPPHVLEQHFDPGMYKPHPNPKSIAIPTLGTKVGFPFEDAAPIAITTIIKFLNNNPDNYNDIYLSVDDTMQFNKYQRLLLKNTGWLDKICLFYLGYILDEKSVLSELPLDVIKLILRLI